MGISSNDYDFSGWATRANMKCSYYHEGRVYR